MCRRRITDGDTCSVTLLNQQTKRCKRPNRQQIEAHETFGGERQRVHCRLCVLDRFHVHEKDDAGRGRIVTEPELLDGAIEVRA
jgi:hypothetical protein